MRFVVSEVTLYLLTLLTSWEQRCSFSPTEEPRVISTFKSLVRVLSIATNASNFVKTSFPGPPRLMIARHSRMALPDVEPEIRVVPSTFRVNLLDVHYRGTSLIRKRTPLGPYRRTMPRVLGESLLMGQVPLYCVDLVQGQVNFGPWGTPSIPTPSIPTQTVNFCVDIEHLVRRLGSERKHDLSTEPFPASAYVGSSKILKDLKVNINDRPF